MHKEISTFCAKIGENRLLVQGAGGNASWKDFDTLWIKGSGTWLADAEKKDIFVPVNLSAIKNSICADKFDVKISSNQNYPYQPSIETVLHALMPQSIVLHLQISLIVGNILRIHFKKQC